MYTTYADEINEEELYYEQPEHTSDIQLPPAINTLLLMSWVVIFLCGLAVIYLAKNPLIGALIIAMPTFIGMVIKPTFALCMMMLVLPTGAGIGYKQAFSLDRGVGLALAFSFLLNLMLSRPQLRIRHNALWVLMIYTIWIVFTSLAAPHISLEFGRAFTQIQLLALTLIVYWILQTNGERTFIWALRSFVIGTLGTIILASISGTAMEAMEESAEARYAATLGEAINVNMLAALLGLAFLAAIYLFARDKNVIWRIVNLIAILFLPIMLLRTASRGALAAVAFATLSPLLFVRQVLRRPALAALLFLVIVFASGSAALFVQKQSFEEGAAERLTDIERAKENIAYRITLIKKAIGASITWPMGTSYHGWFERTNETHLPHSDFFLVLGVYGLPGATLFLLFLLLLLITVKHSSMGMEKLYTRAVLIFLVISGLSHAFIYAKFFWAFSAFIIAGQRTAMFYAEQSKSTAIEQSEEFSALSPAY